MRHLLAITLALVAQAATAAPQAEPLAQRMLDALGGGERHWRRTREGTIAPVSEETLAIDRRFYQGHVYRTLHRIAKRDRALRLSVGREGRLEVHEGTGRIAWYLLDRAGQPYRYGAHDDEAGGIFGPWDVAASGARC